MENRIENGRALQTMLDTIGWKKYEKFLDDEIHSCADKMLAISPSYNYSIEMALLQGRLKAFTEAKEWSERQISMGRSAEIYGRKPTTV